MGLDLGGDVDDPRQSFAAINEAARCGMADFTKLDVVAGGCDVAINGGMLEHLLWKQAVQATDVKMDGMVGWVQSVWTLEYIRLLDLNCSH